MLRPEISPGLRAAIVPSGFTTAPVLQAMHDTQALHELHMQQQTNRIKALEASIIHMQAKHDASDARIKWLEEENTGLKAAMCPHAPIDCDVVLTLTVNDFDYLCGFCYANDVGEPLRLELQELWAIGAVQLTDEFDMQKLRDVLERTAEKQLRDEAQEMRDELAIDSYIFKLEGY